MGQQRRITLIFTAVSVLTLLLFVANLFVGSVSIPVADTLNVLTGGDAARASHTFIILHARVPAAVTALLCGASLAVSGLMLQTAFSNPLAGPSILGISSGANLGVALVMLAGTGSFASTLFADGSLLASDFSLLVILAAFVGAMLVMALILIFSTVIRSNLMLLIVGIMVGYITSSAISLLNFFATDEGVHSYVIWGMGNFSGVSLEQLPLFSLLCLAGLLMSVLLIKPLNALLLGSQYAENLGINIRRTRNLLLVATGLLTAVTTAYCGPIAFIGLAVPHIARLLLHSDNHQTLLPLTIIIGAAVALVCNLVTTMPGESGIIPLNAITPLIGAPVIIYVIMSRRVRNT